MKMTIPIIGEFRVPSNPNILTRYLVCAVVRVDENDVWFDVFVPSNPDIEPRLSKLSFSAFEEKWTKTTDLNVGEITRRVYDFLLKPKYPNAEQ
jgi:hypothetical protein